MLYNECDGVREILTPSLYCFLGKRIESKGSLDYVYLYMRVLEFIDVIVKFTTGMKMGLSQ